MEVDINLKKEKELNCIGYPHDDPYGLAEAWWKIFTKPVKKEKTKNKKQKDIDYAKET